MRSKLGVLDFNPIQYRTPLYQRLAQRGRVDIDVLFLSDHGHRTFVDPAFGIPVAWDIDLLSGYKNSFLNSQEIPIGTISQLRKLRKWILAQDVTVIHGHTHPLMLSAMVLCRTHRVPYLLRGESHAQSQSTGLRRQLRNVVARTVVSGSVGGLAIGQLNEEFYLRYRARRVFSAPYSVDNERFANPAATSRSHLLRGLGLDDTRPVIMFCGKLYEGKRPLDLAAAVNLLQRPVTVLFVGDGPLADHVRASIDRDTGVVTGFINQSELPSFYHAADILVLPSAAETWGLVINEAMAAGVLPIVSDRVGAAPDLVNGIGEIYPCGDVTQLADALRRALARISDPQVRIRVRQHVARHSLDSTAAGFERAMITIGNGPRVQSIAS